MGPWGFNQPIFGSGPKQVPDARVVSGGSCRLLSWRVDLHGHARGGVLASWWHRGRHVWWWPGNPFLKVPLHLQKWISFSTEPFKLRRLTISSHSALFQSPEGASYSAAQLTKQQRNSSRPASGVRKVAKARGWERHGETTSVDDSSDGFPMHFFVSKFHFSGRTCLRKTVMKQNLSWRDPQYQRRKKLWRLSSQRQGSCDTSLSNASSSQKKKNCVAGLLPWGHFRHWGHKVLIFCCFAAHSTELGEILLSLHCLGRFKQGRLH